MRQATPEQYGFGKRVDIRKYSGTGRTETRHALEKSGGHTRLVTTDEKRQHTYGGKYYPRKRNTQKTVTATHTVFGMAAKHFESYAQKQGAKGRYAETQIIVLTIKQPQSQTTRQQQNFKEKQRAKYL